MVMVFNVIRGCSNGPDPSETKPKGSKDEEGKPTRPHQVKTAATGTRVPGVTVAGSSSSCGTHGGGVDRCQPCGTPIGLTLKGQVNSMNC